MTKSNDLAAVIEIPANEQQRLDELIKSNRNKLVRTSQEIVDKVFIEQPAYLQNIHEKKISLSIFELRELVYSEFLADEAMFNIALMQKLQEVLKTPKDILEHLIKENITGLEQDLLYKKINSVCGEYAGRVFPYMYRIALSNTQSRRSRAGKTFEAIIYKIYEALGYEYDSQSKVGRRTFEELGLGKKVDSILPNIDCYGKRRNKTIIGTMKTSLRERWQEVAEEIERTKIPEIHLLTADDSISRSKAQEMANHNIVVVTYDWVADSDSLKSRDNIISFEDYMFREIPSIFKFWKKNV